jgi:hypothetical protein
MNPLSEGLGGPRAGSMVVTLAVVALVLVLRNSRPRPLKLERLWLRPLLSLVMVGAFFSEFPPRLEASIVAGILLGAVAGVAIGWQRGRFMHIEVDPVTHNVTGRMSQIGVIFVLAIFLGRYLLRGVLTGPAAAAVTDGLVTLSAGMMVTQQVEVGLRARRLLAQARAGSAA